MNNETKTDKLPETFGPIINLKPKGSMISQGELTGTNYHVTKFYSRVRQEGNSWKFMGFEATEKHILGHCKYCEIDEAIE